MVGTIEEINPRELVNSNTMDLMVKFRLFEHFLHGRNDVMAERLYVRYLEHARACSGKKTFRLPIAECLEYRAFALFRSMQAKGFDPDCPVTVNQTNGLIVNGTHRIACALALGLMVWCCSTEQTRGEVPCTVQWFMDHGMADMDLVRVHSDLDRVRRAC